MTESNATTIAGLAVSVLLLFSLLYVVSSAPFPYGDYVSPRLASIRPTEDLGWKMSGFLWGYRGLDLFMQTLVLFATAISCLALLREERK
jgi:hypothetical protein